MKKNIKYLSLALALILALSTLGCLDILDEILDEPDPGQTHLTHEANNAENAEIAGNADAPPADFDISDIVAITQGEGEVGVLSGGEEFGSGFVGMMGEGEENDQIGSNIGMQGRARSIRRVVKQDVYGRELPEWFYFYRNLLTDAEQRIYDQIYANAVEFDPYFEITTTVRYERLDDIIIAVRFDNPDLFWLETNYWYTFNRSGHVTSMRLSFHENAVNNIDEYKWLFYNTTDSVLEYVMHFSDDIYKIKYIHDLLTNINTYEWAYMNQSAYSALVRGRTVCAGYGMAFQYMMQRLGIPSVVLFGYAGEAHLWNMVYLDGEWYEMDVTWNDPIGNPPYIYYYDYFNITTGQMGNRERYSLSSLLPAAHGTLYSYYNYFGNMPGSDFSGISYGSPRVSLPPVYPGENVIATRVQAPAGIPDYDMNEVFSGTAEYVTFEEVEEWIYYMTDEEWDELWEMLEYELSPEELEMVINMDWYDFIELITASINWVYDNP